MARGLDFTTLPIAGRIIPRIIYLRAPGIIYYSYHKLSLYTEMKKKKIFTLEDRLEYTF